ncbi:MAG: outer membrane protein assembly factor BamB [Gammaproteobacteria bacterium]|nr:outer membrane protein assembly factor BamB [Gammaproteobacteria bacterium]MDH3505546.1 outer membrane protein assembly factor BamB [Gammaproteobacteria bacterium]
MRLRLALCLAAFLATASGCGMFGGGGEDPIEPPAELVEFEPRLEIDRVWSARVGGAADALRLALAPATDGTRIYAGAHDGQAAAFDAETGRRLWATRTQLPLAAGPGFGGGVLAFGTNDGDLITLDAETGEERWRLQVGGEVLASPAIGGDVVVLSTVDGRLRGYSVLDGRLRWTVEHAVPALTVRGNTAPVISGTTVVAGFDNGRLGAYEVATGETRWEAPLTAPAGRTELDRIVDISAGLAIVGNDVYAVGYNGRAVAVGLETGLLIWQQEMSSYAGLGAGFADVYVADDLSQVVALDRQSGTRRWTQPELRLRDISRPTFYRGTVVVGDLEGYLHWLDAQDGSFLARERVGSRRITSAPLVVGAMLYAQGEDGTLAAFTIAEEDS